jgi:hypothetical protein
VREEEEAVSGCDGESVEVFDSQFDGADRGDDSEGNMIIWFEFCPFNGQFQLDFGLLVIEEVGELLPQSKLQAIGFPLQPHLEGGPLQPPQADEEFGRLVIRVGDDEWGLVADCKLVALRDG